MEKPLQKQYLYHMVPEDIEPNEEGRKVLHPLNTLKEILPELYMVKAEKYSTDERRKKIPELLIPTLGNVTWADVIQLTAINPHDLKDALVGAGFRPKELKFYQIDPEMLDPKKTTIYLYHDSLGKENQESYIEYDPTKLSEYSLVPQKTKDYYNEKFSKNERPLLFVGVPHIFHKGSIDVSDFPVIIAD